MYYDSFFSDRVQAFSLRPSLICLIFFMFAMFFYKKNELVLVKILQYSCEIPGS